MIRIDAIKTAVSQVDLASHLLPGEPFVLTIPTTLAHHPLVKHPTDQEVYALRSAILVGEVFPSLYGKLEVDFIRTAVTDATYGNDTVESIPALQITYIPKGITDSHATVRPVKNAAFPETVHKAIAQTSHRPELARALWEKRWAVRLIAQAFGCSVSLIRRDIGRTTLDLDLVTTYADQLPSAPITLITTRQGIHARDRDREFEFRKTVGEEHLRELKSRVEQYTSMCLEHSRADKRTRAFANQLWLDVDDTIKQRRVSVSRLAVELGYTTSGLRNAIAQARKAQQTPFPAPTEGATG